MMKYKEVYDYVYSKVEPDVRSQWTMKRLESRDNNVCHERRIKNEENKKILKGNLMEMYNKYKQLSFPEELCWCDNDFREFYSSTDVLNDLKEEFPDKLENDLLEVIKNVGNHMDMPSTYHMCCVNLKNKERIGRLL